MDIVMKYSGFFFEGVPQDRFIKDAVDFVEAEEVGKLKNDVGGQVGHDGHETEVSRVVAQYHNKMGKRTTDQESLKFYFTCLQTCYNHLIMKGTKTV